MGSNRFEDSPRRERRNSTFSLSAAFRSSSKRASVTDPLISPELLDVQPTCLERIHYPVFDPHNPQHNPTVASTRQQSPLGHRQYFQESSSESNRQSSWLEDFPRRSIHKARSGLLAIRASIFRLSSRENSDLSDSVIEKFSRENASPERNGAREAGLSSATEEDLSFGIRLYRTSTSPWGPALTETEENSMPRVESPLSIVNFMTAPVEPENYHHHARHETGPSNDQHVSMTSEEPPPYRSIEEIVRCHRLSKDSNPREYANEELGAESVSETYGCLTRSSPSADWDELGSPASSFRYEDMIPRQDVPRTSIISPVGSIRSSEHGSVTAQSDEFVSHDNFTSPLRSATVDIDEHENSKAAPNSSSEVVTIAFPGIYQALLEQWTSDLRKNVKNIPFVPKNPGYSSFMVAQALQGMDGEDSGREPSRERHSFGLHMALRTEQEILEGANTDSERDRVVFATQPYELPTPTDSRDSSSPSGWNGTIESLYDGSEYSTNTTFQSSSPVNGTSSTFYSNDIWSPLESPIDEELLFSPFPRNEFYTADGKTSGYYPSPDNQPVKSEGRFCGDGSLHSGWGLDRTHSERLREITESIPTMRPSRSTRVDSQILQVGREDSGSTDESPVTGYIVNRSRAP